MLKTLARSALFALVALTANFAFAESHVLQRGPVTVRAAAILTTGYVGTTSLDMALNNTLNCFVSFTKGSLTTAEVKAQFSSDNSTWFDEGILNTAAGSTSSDEFISALRTNVYQLDTTSTKAIAVPVLAKYARLAIKGTGTVTSSSATISCYGGAL